MELDEAIEKATSWMGDDVLCAELPNAWLFTFPKPDNPVETIAIGGPVAYMKDTGETVSVLISELNGGRFGKQIARRFGMSPGELLDALSALDYAPIPV